MVIHPVVAVSGRDAVVGAGGDLAVGRVAYPGLMHDFAALDGDVVEVVGLTNSAEPSWDWRTVSFWETTLGPGWRHLRHSAGSI